MSKRSISVIFHVECKVESEFDEGEQAPDAVELAEAISVVANSFKKTLQSGVTIVHSHVLAEPWNPSVGSGGSGETA